MKKIFLIASLCLLIISCSSSGDETDLSFSNLGSDEYPQMFYMEYVPCQEGVYYSAENFRNDVLPEWQDLLVEVNSPLVSAYGIQHVQRLSEDEEDGFWQLIWNSKTDAEAAWKIWNTNENVTAWTEETAEILSCDGEKKFSLPFSLLFPLRASLKMTFSLQKTIFFEKLKKTNQKIIKTF